MYLSAQVNNYINLLRSKAYYNDMYIIAAFPYTYSPTRLDRPLITVSPCGIDAKRAGIGADEFYGTYGIRVDVFVPQSSGSPCAEDIIGEIIDDTAELYPLSYEVSEVKAADSISCFTANVKFKHSDII
ncbi:MAG: hypothetical protein IJI47_00830 [Eubacterium sp.]|nr:hypothetical protein [Eubacterium sp.]